jgi:hypothetical protein
LELKISKKLLKGYICSVNFVWCWNFDTAGHSSEKTGTFWKMVLEKDGEDQVDQSGEKLSNIWSQGGNKCSRWRYEKEG